MAYADFGQPQTIKQDDDIDNIELCDSKEGLACSVCGDIATGRHYGAIACNGCKGFFRRTIRRGYKYTCRFQSQCVIDKHNRAVCRYCRYTRCISSGMKVDQVQNERDVIGKRHRVNSGPAISTGRSHMKRNQSNEEGNTPKRGSPVSSSPSSDAWDQGESIINALLHSENATLSLRETVIKQTGDVDYITNPSPKIPPPSTATLNDVFKSLHSQLLLVIEWAKTLPPFVELSTEDQTALLKNFATQHVVLCVAYRSAKETADRLKLLNDRYIPRTSQTGEYMPEHGGLFLRDCDRVIDQMVAPMRFLNVDDSEFVAMKACVLFNPVAKGLSPAAVQPILDTRRKIFAALEQYVRTNKPSDIFRIGDLAFFFLTPLSTLANSLSEDIMVTKLSGVARIDMLMEELILRDADDDGDEDSAALPHDVRGSDQGPSRDNAFYLPSRNEPNHADLQALFNHSPPNVPHMISPIGSTHNQVHQTIHSQMRPPHESSHGANHDTMHNSNANAQQRSQQHGQHEQHGQQHGQMHHQHQMSHRNSVSMNQPSHNHSIPHNMCNQSNNMSQQGPSGYHQQQRYNENYSQHATGNHCPPSQSCDGLNESPGSLDSQDQMWSSPNLQNMSPLFSGGF